MLSIAESWQPLSAQKVDAHAIPGTDLVDLQIALDGLPDHSWMTLFKSTLARRRPEAAPATFLGRFIYVQPPQAQLQAMAHAVQAAISDTNDRYCDEVMVVRHQPAALALT